MTPGYQLLALLKPYKLLVCPRKNAFVVCYAIIQDQSVLAE